MTSVIRCIAADCGDAYAKASDKTRRLFNEAVFKKVLVRDGRVAAPGFQEPFDALLSVTEFAYGSVVETMGLEPTTPCLQSRCSSQLSYVPWPATRPNRALAAVSR